MTVKLHPLIATIRAMHGGWTDMTSFISTGLVMVTERQRWIMRDTATASIREIVLLIQSR